MYSKYCSHTARKTTETITLTPATTQLTTESTTPTVIQTKPMRSYTSTPKTKTRLLS
jgi:hypothetical protein